jgi:hypothetical protein
VNSLCDEAANGGTERLAGQGLLLGVGGGTLPTGFPYPLCKGDTLHSPPTLTTGSKPF